MQNVASDPCSLSAAIGIDVELEADISHLLWIQPMGTLTLQPWEFASMGISYRPEQGTETPG